MEVKVLPFNLTLWVAEQVAEQQPLVLMEDLELVELVVLVQRVQLMPLQLQEQVAEEAVDDNL
tara:strand:+ start:572 stop:760 length:189 start_codon:yes stop_codon:yes gene_type:complete